jgi:hypothetical protein
MDFSVVTSFDSDDIAREMSEQLTNEELVEFIVLLDLCVADWGFTEELYKHFKSEHKTYKAEVKEYR